MGLLAGRDEEIDGTIARWTKAEVAAWVETTVGLPEYREAFLAQEVDGLALLELVRGEDAWQSSSDQLLREELLRNSVGAVALSHRKSVLPE